MFETLMIDFFCLFDSAIQFLINEYKVDPNTFLYDWKYDTHEKHSIMTQAYIDLGNYLSSKNKFFEIELDFYVV